MLQADKSAFKAKKIGGNKNKAGPGGAAGKGGKNGGAAGGKPLIDTESIDYNKKILHASWHPRENTVSRDFSPSLPPTTLGLSRRPPRLDAALYVSPAPEQYSLDDRTDYASIFADLATRHLAVLRRDLLSNARPATSRRRTSRRYDTLSAACPTVSRSLADTQPLACLLRLQSRPSTIVGPLPLPQSNAS